MLKTIQSFNGHDINSNQYKVIAHNFNTLPAANPVFISEAQADSVDSGAWTVEVRTNTITIQIIDYANRHTLADQLRVWFKRGTSGNLVATFHDEDDVDLDYQLTGRVVNLIEDSDYSLLYTAVLKSGQTAWRAVNSDEDTTWSPTGTDATTGTHTHTITPGGTDETRLSVKLTPIATPPGVYLYQNIIQLVNVPGVEFGWKTFFLTLDTATLIAAGKMQDDCNDLRLKDADVEIPRWIQNPNTSATTVAFTLKFSAGHALTLSGGVAQIETATAVHAITGAGTAAVTVTAAGMTGSPKTINVTVANGDSPAVWAGKVRAALRLDAAVTALFAVSGSGNKIVLMRNSPAGNDSTLNIALANGTCTGITAAPTSVNTRTGVLYSVPSSGVVNTLNFVQKVDVLPPSGNFIMFHGTEWFSCTRINAAGVPVLTPFQLRVVQRGALGTTEQAHSGGNIFKYIEHPLIMYYGNDSATDPSTAPGYNNYKPVYSLIDSDQTKAVYTAASLFYGPNRPGSWTQFINRKGTNSKLYNFKEDASSGEPALGIKSAAYLQNKSWVADNVTIGWKLVDAGGISRVTFTGRKYRTDTVWPKAKLQCSKDGSTWVDVFTEASPASPDTFTAWAAHTNIDIDPINPGSTMIRLAFLEKSDKIANSYGLMEALTCIIYWTTANIPTPTLLGEQSNYYLNVRIRNTATLGNIQITDSVILKLAMRLDLPLTLDGENFTAEYHSVNVHGAITLDDKSRTVWIRLLPGVTNQLSIYGIVEDNDDNNDDADIGTVDVDLSYYRRRL